MANWVEAVDGTLHNLDMYQSIWRQDDRIFAAVPHQPDGIVLWRPQQDSATTVDDAWRDLLHTCKPSERKRLTLKIDGMLVDE